MKTSSPISHRSMWNTIAPFSRVIDWNWGEKGSSLPSVRQRLRVIRQRTRGNIHNRGLKGSLARRVLQIHQLGVARHAIRNPGVVQRRRRNLAPPPLMGKHIREQPLKCLGRPSRAPLSPTISGPHVAETESSGSSTIFIRADSGWPNVPDMN